MATQSDQRAIDVHSAVRSAQKMEHLYFFDEEQVQAALHYSDLIPAIATALMEFSAGRVEQPPRTILRLDTNQSIGWFACMPAVYQDVMGAKLVTFFPGNAQSGEKNGSAAGHALPTHMATIQLFSPTTGQPLAVLDGRCITEMRTAAVSAVALQLLAAPEARVLAILGSGVQARAHLEALCLVRQFAEVRIASRTLEGAQAFVDAVMQESGNCFAGIDMRAVTTEQAVRGADVIVTATSASQPVLRGAWLEPHALVLAIGAVAHDRRELDEEAMQRGAVLVESRETAMRESGDILLSGAAIYAELGELLSSTLPLPPEGIRVFKSLGLAVADLAAARLVYFSAKG